MVRAISSKIHREKNIDNDVRKEFQILSVIEISGVLYGAWRNINAYWFYFSSLYVDISCN